MECLHLHDLIQGCAKYEAVYDNYSEFALYTRVYISKPLRLVNGQCRIIHQTITALWGEL